MEKSKTIVSALTLIVAIGTAYAFKANTTTPKDLYYFNELGVCSKSPCEITKKSGIVCETGPLFTNDDCTSKFSKEAWVKCKAK
jgi:hypothetical protein